MKKIFLILIILFLGMQALGWWAYKKNKNDNLYASSEQSEIKKQPEAGIKDKKDSAVDLEKDIDIPAWDGNLESFPPPTVEEVDGKMQRVIHMGVRQWQWDPAEIEVKLGEKVILIMHNADVMHSISIPDLGMNEKIPEEGAVIIFEASKRGTFEFFCAVPCGKGHGKMRGKITVL